MSEEAALRGRTSRALMAMDARWAQHVVLSAGSSDDEVRGILPLLVAHHLVRIIYEGARLLRMEEPNFGIPEVAALLVHWSFGSLETVAIGSESGWSCTAGVSAGQRGLSRLLDCC